MEKINLSTQMLLAIDDAKKSGDIDAIRKTANYREMLADMDKRAGTHAERSSLRRILQTGGQKHTRSCTADA